MKKSLLVLLFAILIPATMTAQMEIRPNGQTVIGDRFYKVLQSSGDHVVFDPVYATYETETDEDASMVVLGPEENSAWGYTTFGEDSRVEIKSDKTVYLNSMTVYDGASLTIYAPNVVMGPQCLIDKGAEFIIKTTR